MNINKNVIINQTAWLRRNGGGIITLLRNHEKRIKILEKRLQPQSQLRDRWEIKCDAPNCGKKRTFECGENIYGQVGGWCSKKHFKKFAKHYQPPKEPIR